MNQFSRSPNHQITKSPNIELLIFDLDGTLIDSQADLAAAVNATRARLDLPPLEMSVVASYVGRGAPELIRRALGAGFDNQEIERSLEFFLRHYRMHMLDQTRLYPGVAEAIEAFSDRILAVLTNKPVRFSREILDRLGLSARFRFIYGGNSFAQKKPDPAGVLSMLADTGLGARQAMMVGDSQVDVLTGRNAGAWTCGVTYGFEPGSFRIHPPDLLVGSLLELASALRDGL